MSVLGKLRLRVVLDAAGLALVALAIGLWLVPVGIGAAGIGLLLLSQAYGGDA